MKVRGDSWIDISYFSLSDLNQLSLLVNIPDMNRLLFLSILILLIMVRKLGRNVRHRHLREFNIPRQDGGRKCTHDYICLFFWVKVYKRSSYDRVPHLALELSCLGNWVGSTWLLSKHRWNSLLNGNNRPHTGQLWCVCSAVMIK